MMTSEDMLVDCMSNLVQTEGLDGTIAIMTIVFVALVERMVKDEGGEPRNEIQLDNDLRTVTLHAVDSTHTEANHELH